LNLCTNCEKSKGACVCGSWSPMFKNQLSFSSEYIGDLRTRLHPECCSCHECVEESDMKVSTLKYLYVIGPRVVSDDRKVRWA